MGAAAYWPEDVLSIASKIKSPSHEAPIVAMTLPAVTSATYALSNGSKFSRVWLAIRGPMTSPTRVHLTEDRSTLTFVGLGESYMGHPLDPKKASTPYAPFTVPRLYPGCSAASLMPSSLNSWNVLGTV